MKRWSLDTGLGLLALLTFAATRLIGLAQYPIYFFTDEAANTVLAAEFLDSCRSSIGAITCNSVASC